jgi:hypothetical protein
MPRGSGKAFDSCGTIMINIWRLAVLASVSVCCGPSVHAEQISFVLPWNDAAPGITDLSSWNQNIGPNDRVSGTPDGHFVVNGKRIRFFGMNFAGDGPFQPTNKADAVAARVSKFGINCIRFHHMDAPWALNGGLIDYRQGNSRQFQRSQLELLHFLVARLKAHGVYANINLLVGREFKPGDGLPAEIASLDWKVQHVLGFFNDTALALHKEYAIQLLTPVNPYTGLSLAQDPAVAFVEIMNENGMVHQWFDGALDTLPAVFAGQLQGRWNEWLKARYPDDAALLAAWKPVDQPLGTNLVKNGAFIAGLSGWSMEEHQGADAVFSVTNGFNGQPAVRVEIVKPGTESWHVQLNQPGLRLTQDQVYTFSFYAKADEATGLSVSIMEAHTNWATLGYAQTVSLTHNWQPFTATFLAPRSDANARPNFGGFATKQVAVWIADVRFQAGGQVGILPAGASLAARNLPNVLRNAGTSVATADAQRDWLRFLLELERRYWEGMAQHVRERCGYPGLIFGTVIANSPPNTQALLDVVDAHAYWQHPQFPVRPWDPVNWFVSNVSLVNTVGDNNPLSSLARQRVQGKPFTVTEYQHPSPNYYGAEGPLLLAAYGALQDWDGLWLFEYGRGNDTAATGCFRGFFDTGQHPTKMANLLVAAALFRRGDVTPALQEYPMAVTPETELEILLKAGGAWSVMNGGHLGVSSKLALASRLSLSVGSNARGLTNPPASPAGSVISSDTGQLTWNLSQSNQGVVTVQTPRTKAVVGFVNQQPIDLGGITFRTGATQLGWATLSLILREGPSMTNGGRLLFVASGQVDNTGMQWLDTAQSTVGTNWGRAPVLVEVVPFQLILPVSVTNVKAFALDELGQRKQELLVREVNGQASLMVTNNTGTFWYEIWTAADAPFERWRFANFSGWELADPTLSSETATPAGDGIPNLMKYASGLPAKVAATHSLIRGRLLQIEGQVYAALNYTRLKHAEDVAYYPEITPDLANWLSGPDYLQEAERTDLGLSELVTVRDRTPLGAIGRRFLRLKVERLPD